MKQGVEERKLIILFVLKNKEKGLQKKIVCIFYDDEDEIPGTTKQNRMQWPLFKFSSIKRLSFYRF